MHIAARRRPPPARCSPPHPAPSPPAPPLRQYAIFHDTPEVLDGYSHIAVWDDDVESAGGCGAINRMFDTAARLNAWVSGPAFSGNGRISHWNTARNQLWSNCWTGFVEARPRGRGVLRTAAAASSAARARTAHLSCIEDSYPLKFPQNPRPLPLKPRR